MTLKKNCQFLLHKWNQQVLIVTLPILALFHPQTTEIQVSAFDENAPMSTV